MSARRALLASTLGLAALSGCQVGPDFKRPDAVDGQRYTSQRLQVESGTTPLQDQQIRLGDSPDKQWWHLFESEALNAVVGRALENNRTLVAANATLAQARELAE